MFLKHIYVENDLYSVRPYRATTGDDLRPFSVSRAVSTPCWANSCLWQRPCSAQRRPWPFQSPGFPCVQMERQPRQFVVPHLSLPGTYARPKGRSRNMIWACKEREVVSGASSQADPVQEVGGPCSFFLFYSSSMCASATSSTWKIHQNPLDDFLIETFIRLAS